LRCRVSFCRYLMMLNIILYQPEIPPNTGNIIRLCANAGAQLHLVEPMGFQLDHSRLKRAGLDYHELINIKRYSSWNAFLQQNKTMPIWSFSTSGTIRHDQVKYQHGDGLLFGPETRGLPGAVIEQVGKNRCLLIPMIKQSRSLNLSNTVAIGLYEAWRQLGFTP